MSLTLSTEDARPLSPGIGRKSAAKAAAFKQAGVRSKYLARASGNRPGTFRVTPGKML